MQRRIFGIETEFGVTCTFHGQRRLSPDEVARYLFRRVVSWGRSSNVFLRNGSRLYLDVGSHPEYATAECDDLAQLVTHDKAGERILEDLLVDAERRLADEGIGGDIFLFKNNTDSAGNSYGCHENYLVARAGEFSRIADVLLPFLVTRQLICGAGKVLQTPRGAVYCLSQRAEHIWEGVSSATTRSRPIINTRDEPHADAERYRRLHVIVGDSNMSEVTTLLKVGSANLVLEMIEQGVQFRDFSLDNPIRAIREISHDLTGRRTVRLAGGKEASALDIQREYYERAVEHVAKRAPDPMAERVLELWGRTLDAVASEDLSKIDREIDWAIKYRLMERYQAKHDMDLSNPRIAQLDLAYHDIRRGRGIFDLLQRKDQVERVTDDGEIEAAKDTPPQTTRAKLRGDFIAAAQAAGRDFTVDWVHLKLNDQAQRTVLCKDPFRAVDERVERLISSL
ncbi:Pup--protein ligase [Saccharothrix sp. NRRL B-16348]|jgi:proteasome accessory factor A|uniref:Pup--protein ligase n=1 Tax=Saccharothrix texasensis TaxID=103734 RepID=A0A3N1H145_9PSEU|nr:MULTISPECIES: Pup--protein ligase [Saccharothrix]KOX27992.1 Pup--protein ligase [Saccharothrix sp. NRRL B-16348]MCC8243695.1 Pup--protein ligase [Saccharothrix luteola]OKI20031.1 Pup--protein ligase [Saccharothrix sp. CB00851]QQQ79022.1 Pup--protein ligase [Saccharothrix sp. 6-C]ROP36199.1 proteasome accessory factor A [Saccharothrix texasensis]